MVTTKDIAKRVGVSRTTVSLVLNNRHTAVRISDKTRRRVEETAVQMGYHRNEIARSMVTGKTKVIGFLSMSISAEYTAPILSGVMEQAVQYSYFIKLFPVSQSENFKNTVIRCIEDCVAGVICRSLDEEMLDCLYREVSHHQIPIAIVGSSFSHPWGVRVISDDRHGSYLAVEHLVGLGHKHIAHISFRPERGGFATFRKEGYVAAMEHFSLEAPENTLFLGEIRPR